MNTKTLRKLEYDKIIQLLADHAASESGKERCLSLLPQTDLSVIEQMQEETAAAFTRIVKKGKSVWIWGLHSVPPSFLPSGVCWNVQARRKHTAGMIRSMRCRTVWILISSVWSRYPEPLPRYGAVFWKKM